jgi:hypothetical protein
MENQQKPLTLRIGVEFTIYKCKEMHNKDLTEFLDDDDGDAIDEIVGDIYEGKLYKDKLHDNPNCIFMKLNVSTKNIPVYTSESMK